MSTATESKPETKVSKPVEKKARAPLGETLKKAAVRAPDLERGGPTVVALNT